MSGPVVAAAVTTTATTTMEDGTMGADAGKAAAAVGMEVDTAAEAVVTGANAP
ncbi:protein of unknown function [Paraburkholderia dioscoreae]|uniref:Uncharacterized protein n=2 Tax=Burkholderiaceae TaxID=119060 RepID=A0A5Q4ZBM0_9BURK|nr:protein of unknown function [Paraburkholderia dioscoreae]